MINALEFDNVHLNHEVPLTFAPYLPPYFDKNDPFLLLQVLPLFEMWELCISVDMTRISWPSLEEHLGPRHQPSCPPTQPLTLVQVVVIIVTVVWLTWWSGQHGSGVVIVTVVVWSTWWWSRLRGYLGTTPISTSLAVWLPPSPFIFS